MRSITIEYLAELSETAIFCQMPHKMAENSCNLERFVILLKTLKGGMFFQNGYMGNVGLTIF